jgi:hypothetical protein
VAPRSRFTFTAELWEHDGAGAWHFVDLPEHDADEIEEVYGSRAGGFGSVRVDVTVGSTQWSTSLFPDTTRGTYVLPVTKAVRAAENLVAGEPVTVELAIVE